MNHYAVYLKLTQYCKSAILQFKEIMKEKTENIVDNVHKSKMGHVEVCWNGGRGCRRWICDKQ